MKSLLDEIKKEESKHKPASAKNEEYYEHQLKAKSEKIISDINSTRWEKNTNTEEIYINKLINELPFLIYTRSRASKKAVSDTIIDIIELIYKFKDFLDVPQLSRMQHHDNVKKVWVFADHPIEFDAGANEKVAAVLRDRILDNLEHNVEYTYIVSKKFDPDHLNKLFKKNMSANHKDKLKKRLHIIKIDSKYFKTFFTLHFDSKERYKDPCGIFMSALLPERKDLLIQISEEKHFARIFERIKKLVGHVSESPYHVINHVVED